MSENSANKALSAERYGRYRYIECALISNPDTERFVGCTSLTNIPEDLFAKNLPAEKFTDCFQYCSGLTGIPEKLFAKNTEAVTFATCFLNCKKLVLNKNIFCDEATQKTTRFAGVDVDFTRCFENVGSDVSGSSNAGTAPELWNYAGTFTNKAECFKGIGIVTNANSIPDAWKNKQQP